MKKRKHKWIFLLVVVAIIVVIIGMILLLPSNSQKPSQDAFPEEKKQIDENNYYKYDDQEMVMEGTQIVQADGLKDAHCVETVCVTDVKFVLLPTIHKVEYTVTNISEVEQTGYLRMNFGEESTLVSFQKLKPKESVTSSFQFFGDTISKANNYTLEELTKEEIQQIKVHSK